MLEGFFDWVKLIIAITGQETLDQESVGLAPEYPILGSNTLILARFTIYWRDDNTLQHEVTHCFGPDDHFVEDVWCVMAYKEELIYLGFIREDGILFGAYNMYVKRAF